MCCSGSNAKEASSDSKSTDAKVKSDNEGADHELNDAAESGLHPNVPSWSLFWDVTVYVNDKSGWVLRRTSLGWEIAPNWSADAKYIVKDATPYPPKSGWETVEPASSMVNISSISVPLRWQGRPTMQNLELPGDAGSTPLSVSSPPALDASEKRPGTLQKWGGWIVPKFMSREMKSPALATVSDARQIGKINIHVR